MKNADSPATPTPYMDLTSGCGDLHCDNAGLTKREVFAMHAMQGLLSNSGGVVQADNMSGTGFCNSDEVSLAQWSIACADALLKELDNDN